MSSPPLAIGVCTESVVGRAWSTAVVVYCSCLTTGRSVPVSTPYSDNGLVDGGTRTLWPVVGAQMREVKHALVLAQHLFERRLTTPAQRTISACAPHLFQIRTRRAPRAPRGCPRGRSASCGFALDWVHRQYYSLAEAVRRQFVRDEAATDVQTSEKLTRCRTSILAKLATHP